VNHYLLLYEFVEDYAERRAPHRAVHLGMAWDAHERGDLVLAGALPGDPPRAALMFRGDDPSVARDFAEADPYVHNGVVKTWEVREWHTVVGDQAAHPVRG
jgi:uncharacterized protein YciI